MALEKDLHGSQQSLHERRDVMDPEKEDSIPPVIDDRNYSVDTEAARDQASKEAAANDWTGPTDPENPQNWSKWFKRYHILPPAMISFTSTFATSIYTPALSQVIADFGVSRTAALLPLCIYTLALGLGPILAAPLSETFGRKSVYLIAPPLGALFTLGAGFSPTFAGLVILRFFAGMFFSPALAIGGGTLADIFPPSERALYTAIYILSPFLGPSIGPVIGSFVAVRKGWTWTQWTIIFFAIFSWLTVLPMRETYKKTILARRAKALGLPPAPSSFPTTGAKIKFLFTVTFLRPIHMLVMEPIVAFLSIYVAFNFGVLFTFFAAFPFVFGNAYHFTTEQSGLVFFAIGIGCILAVPTAMICDRYLYLREHRRSVADGRDGVVKPEHRLYPAMIGSFGLPIGLFWFAWTAKSSVHWISPILAAIPFAWGNLSIFVASGMYLVDTYGAMNGASALAANGLLRYIFGFMFPLFTFQMYKALGTGWATSLLGFVTVALMPIPWVLFKYGHHIRGKSHYDTINA